MRVCRSSSTSFALSSSAFRCASWSSSSFDRSRTISSCLKTARGPTVGNQSGASSRAHRRDCDCGQSAQRHAWKCESIVSLGSSLTRGLFLMFFARMPYLTNNGGARRIAEDRLPRHLSPCRVCRCTRCTVRAARPRRSSALCVRAARTVANLGPTTPATSAPEMRLSHPALAGAT